jgi:hypothetical protein
MKAKVLILILRAALAEILKAETPEVIAWVLLQLNDLSHALPPETHNPNMPAPLQASDVSRT